MLQGVSSMNVADMGFGADDLYDARNRAYSLVSEAEPPHQE